MGPRFRGESGRPMGGMTDQIEVELDQVEVRIQTASLNRANLTARRQMIQSLF